MVRVAFPHYNALQNATLTTHFNVHLCTQSWTSPRVKGIVGFTRELIVFFRNDCPVSTWSQCYNSPFSSAPSYRYQIQFHFICPFYIFFETSPFQRSELAINHMILVKEVTTLSGYKCFERINFLKTRKRIFLYTDFRKKTGWMDVTRPG